MKRPGLARVLTIWLGCGLIVVALGFVHIGLGILAMPVFYGIAQSLTE